MASPQAHLLAGAAQNYAWGSVSWIPELMGAEPTGDPVAEVWFGAHPKAPTMVVDDGAASLADLIAQDPDHHLGARCVERFGPKLPYLVKLLAAAEPLSIQLHPSIAQAREGCAREDAAGIDRLAPNRSFRDDNHKPEMIVAITDFEALVGVRAVAETLDLLRSLAVRELHELAGQLTTDGVGSTLETILTMPADAAASMVTAMIAGCNATDASDRWAAEAELLVRLDHKYPGDRGVLTAALLNRVVLTPGEAVFLDAGNLHAYVHGFGVEIMANSDNVLRGGLTPKHIDVQALLEIVDASPLNPQLQSPASPIAGYVTPVPEFTVTRFASPDNTMCWDEGPRVVLSVGAEAVVTVGAQVLSVRSGSAAWIPAAAPEIAVSSDADVFVTRLNL